MSTEANQTTASDPEQWQSDWANLNYLDRAPAPPANRPGTDLRTQTFALGVFLSIGIVLVLAFIGFMASVVRSFHG